MMPCHRHGYPWPSLATSSYRSSPQVGLQGHIPYPHIAAECMFELVVLRLPGHMWGEKWILTRLKKLSTTYVFTNHTHTHKHTHTHTYIYIYIYKDELNTLQLLICHKTLPTNHLIIKTTFVYLKYDMLLLLRVYEITATTNMWIKDVFKSFIWTSSN